MGQVPVVVFDGDAVAHAVVGIGGGELRGDAVGTGNDRGGDHHQAVVLAVAVSRRAALGVGDAGAVVHHVIDVAGDAVLRGVAAGGGIGGGDQHVVAVVDVDHAVAVGVFDTDAVTHRIVAVDGDVAFGVGDGQQAVVVVVGVGGDAATAIGKARAVAEVVEARERGVAFGVDGLDVVAEGVVEVLGHLLLGQGHEIGLIEENGLLYLVAEAVVGKAGKIPARAFDFDQVLLGVVAVVGGDERIAHGRGLGGQLIKRGVGVAGDVVGVVRALDEITVAVILQMGGKALLQCGDVAGGELRHQFALPGQAVHIAEVSAQIAEVGIVALGNGVGIGVDHRDQVLQRVVLVVRGKIARLGDRQQLAVGVIGVERGVAQADGVGLGGIGRVG